MPAPRNIRNRSKKFSENVTKRGTVSVGKVAERDEEGPGPSKLLVAFFCFVVLGSVVVPVFSLFGRSPLPPAPADQKPFQDGAYEPPPQADFSEVPPDADADADAGAGMGDEN